MLYPLSYGGWGRKTMADIAARCHRRTPVTAASYRSDMELQLTLDQPQVAGPLTLFPVYSDAPAAPDYLPGPRAVDLLEVSEREDGAAVPELLVRNLAGCPVLLVEGETLVGAKQNRTLNVSVLVAPHGKTVIPVSCVEAGRWNTPRSAKRSPRHAPSALRSFKTESVNRSVESGAGRRSDQGEVWAAVADYATHFAVASPTAALEDVHDSIHADVERLARDLTPAEGQRGVLMAVGSTVRSLDLFDKADTLAAYWDSLVRGYAMDALGQPPATATLADGNAFAAVLSEARWSESPGAGLGRELHLTSSDVVATGLHWAGAICHLAAFAR